MFLTLKALEVAGRPTAQEKRNQCRVRSRAVIDIAKKFHHNFDEFSNRNPITRLFQAEASGEGSLVLSIRGQLDSTSTGSIWREAMNVLDHSPAGRVVMDTRILDSPIVMEPGPLFCLSCGVAKRREAERWRSMISRNRLNASSISMAGRTPRFPCQLPAESPSSSYRPGEHPSSSGGDVQILIAFVGELLLGFSMLQRIRAGYGGRMRS